MITVSVVIPCLNEEKYIGLLLDNLARQTRKPDEVIVVDSQSDDQTVAQALKYKDKLSLQVVKSGYRSPGAARNTGAAKAKGDYLIFIDADISIPDNFIEYIRLYLSENPVDFITPKYKSDGKHIIDSYLFWTVDILLYLSNKVFGKLFGIGGVVCVKKSLHNKVGGFNEKMQAHNDIDYIDRLKKKAPIFAYLSNLTVVHSSRRYAHESPPQALLTLLRENTGLGRWFIQPFLSKRGRGKKYGNHV